MIMEKKIVILGNGFDLRHFLPTSYNHLISILSEIEKLPENKNIITFSDLFGNIFKEKNELFYQKIVEYYQTENFTFDLKAIQSLKARLKVNPWFKYFKSVDENKIETWIDFETEIERILISVLKYFESVDNGSLYKPPYKVSSNGEGFFIDMHRYDDYFNSRLQASILKHFHLINIQKGYWVVNEKFILAIENEVQYFKERDFFSSLYGSLEEFIGIFNDYIIIILESFYKNFRKNKKESFLRKNSIFLFDNIDKIYSFNYTNTYVRLYDIDKNDKLEVMERTTKVVFHKNPIGDMDFIHGKANENWNNNFDDLKIVLGVDDIHDSLKKHKLFQFTKYFQKLHKQTDYIFLKNFESNNRTKSGDTYIFYFWGHSLDYSDRQYVREIFHFLDYGSHNQIKIFYHSISAKGDQLKNLLGIIPKEIIETYMKEKKLEFIEATPENLFNEL